MSDIQLFTNQTIEASSSPFNAIGAGAGANLQLTLLTIYGVLDGASVQLEYQAFDNSWYSTGDSAFVTTGAYFAKINPRIAYRLSLSGAGAGTLVSARVYDASAA